jgi:trimeric autotransporter adhesin
MLRRTHALAVLALAGLAAGGGAGIGAGVAQAAPGDIGYQDFSYAPASGSITGSKPESKLWFNDGSWWASMYAPAAGGYTIHRLDRTTHTWISTGTPIDDRPFSRADALWTGSKLYVASHAFAEQGAPGSGARLYRYSYSSAKKAYSLDSGFPVAINATTSETLVIDRDTTGTLWATWTAGNQVWVTHTTTGDGAWAAPSILPGSPALDPDDISSIIAFGGKVGVMYSDQVATDEKVRFAVHQDGAPPGAWSTEIVPTGALPDDHINLKADATGNIFAAVKTSETLGSRPLTLLLKRSPGGTWTSTTFGTVSNSHTRPIVLLDAAGGKLHMFATCPQPPSTSGQAGGDICEKTTSMADPAFTANGSGTPVIRNAGSPQMNDVTSTKQSVTPASGIVVLANDNVTNRYWHAEEPVSGVVALPPPDASFTSSPASGVAPVTVQFTDTSTGGPNVWSWDFGDGTGSTARSPAHTYGTPGTYTVTLTAANANGSTVAIHEGAVTVLPPEAVLAPAPPPGVLTPAPAPVVTGAKSTSATRRLGLHTKRLSKGRVRIIGTLRPELPRARVVLQLRRGKRWVTVRTTLVRHLRAGISEFRFTVTRRRASARYRVILAPKSGAPHGLVASRAQAVRGTAHHRRHRHHRR